MDIQTTISDIRDALRNVSFPAQKDEVVDTAQRQGISGEIMELLQKLPDEQFGSMKDLVSKLPLADIEGTIERFL